MISLNRPFKLTQERFLGKVHPDYRKGFQVYADEDFCQD